MSFAWSEFGTQAVMEKHHMFDGTFLTCLMENFFLERTWPCPTEHQVLAETKGCMELFWCGFEDWVNRWGLFLFEAIIIPDCSCNLSSHLACRTKRWMSDSDFQGTKLLYLPAAVASEVASAPPPPGQLSWYNKCDNLHVFIVGFSIFIWWQSTWQSPWTHRVKRTEPCGNMLLSCVVSSVAHSFPQKNQSSDKFKFHYIYIY